MDWFWDILTTNVVLPFWLLWSPVLSAVVSAFAYTGIVVLVRVLWSHKFYFGYYLSFVIAGIGIAILSAIASIVLDGHTPQAIYTQIWFYPAFIVPVWFGTIKFKKAEAEAHEKKNRPKAVRKLLDEITHTYWAFPYVVGLLFWFGCLAVDVLFFWDNHHLETLWLILPVGAFWVAALIKDSGRPVPVSMEEWMRFMPRLFALYIAFATMVGGYLSV